MKKILVTGGTGFIGSLLARRLVEQEYEVKILRRVNSPLTNIYDIKIEHCIGDVRDIDSLRSAMQGCDTVFHTAAVISFWKPKHTLMYEVNVNGTRNIVQACLTNNIERLVHTSSIAAIGKPIPPHTFADETTPFNWNSSLNGYKHSKYLGEQEVMKGVQQGLAAVIVNPAVVIGPGDIHFNGSDFIRKSKQGLIPFYLQGGMNVAYVEDVVRGHIAAALRGRSGERYILGGTNLTHKEAFQIIARIVNGHVPKINMPVPFVKLAAKFFDGLGTLTNKEPMITSELISGAGLHNWYTSAKAERELGYTITPFEDAVLRTYQWMVEQKLVGTSKE